MACSENGEVYMYQAALYCKVCGDEIREELDKEGKRPVSFGRDEFWDSDDYPKGPYADGGGEADTPQHCDKCGCFVDNPLTEDGRRYVMDAIIERLASGGDMGTVRDWAEFYEISLVDLFNRAGRDR